jgi:imidazoleglycerol phosphate synthase glutamine amidotransferase subunit HisH
MQIMAGKGTEGGLYDGLGWFDATVTRLHPEDPDKRVPNIGWNDVTYDSKIPLFKGLPPKVDFYLVHSFYMKTNVSNDVVATYEYDHLRNSGSPQKQYLCNTISPREKSGLWTKNTGEFYCLATLICQKRD